MIKKLLNGKMMLALVLVSCSVFVARAQQDPQYTQFMYNKLPANPGYTGAREVMSIRASYRAQWLGDKGGGIPGAPQTAVFSIHSPLKNEHFALGFNFVNDRLGVTHTNSFDGSFAYRVDVGKKIKLSIGISTGLLWYKSNLAGSITTDGTAIDPSLNENISRVLANVGAGIYLYHPNFYFGFGVPNFIKGDLTNKNQSFTDAKRTAHFNIMAGGVIAAGKVLKIRPQIMYRYVGSVSDKIPHTLDINLSLLIYDRVNIGAQYRTSIDNKNEGVKLKMGDSFDAMLEVWPTKQLLIGYSYDYTLTKLGNYNRGSHEVIIGYDFALKKKKIITPRYF